MVIIIYLFLLTYRMTDGHCCRYFDIKKCAHALGMFLSALKSYNRSTLLLYLCIYMFACMVETLQLIFHPFPAILDLRKVL